MAELEPRKCEGCGIEYQPRRKDQRYHSKDCRQEKRPGSPWRKKRPEEKPEPESASVINFIAATDKKSFYEAMEKNMPVLAKAALAENEITPDEALKILKTAITANILKKICRAILED